MDLVENVNQLTQVFNKYNIAEINFETKLTIVLPNPGNIDRMFADFLTNVNPSQQYKYVGQVDINGINIFNDMELYTILLDSTHYANKIIMESGLNILSNNTNVWNIFIYDNMMWNLPFTLEDVIFLPLKVLNNARNSNSNYSLIKTLIHEKIHVLQRKNVRGWIDYVYAKDRNWVKINYPSSLYSFLDLYDIDKLMTKMIVKNPDTIYKDFKYIYKKDDNLYYGVLYLNEDRGIDVQWFLITEYKKDDYDKKNTSYTLEKWDKEILPYEHPFEMYAYEISNELTNVKEDEVNKNII
jgi:hypothetical protein